PRTPPSAAPARKDVLPSPQARRARPRYPDNGKVTTPPPGTSVLATHLVDDGVRDLTHGQATVHRRLLDPAERLGLREAHLAHEQALGAVDALARLEALRQVGDLRGQRGDLGVPRDGDLDGRQ